MKTIIVIPSRYESTRFPGKPLAKIAGKSLIQRVWESSRQSRLADGVFVATDDSRIAEHVTEFGGIAVMTSRDHACGTDRIAEAIRKIETSTELAEFVINVQGDEPLADMEAIDGLIECLQAGHSDVATLACPLLSPTDLDNPDVVKVVADRDDRALYFSRAAIPWSSPAIARRHIGIYGFTRDALLAFSELDPAPLEIAERLEQLRLLQNGYTIRILETSSPHPGVDRPEDVARIEALLA